MPSPLLPAAEAPGKVIHIHLVSSGTDLHILWESIAINRAIQGTAGTAQTKAAQTDLIRAQGQPGRLPGRKTCSQGRRRKKGLEELMEGTGKDRGSEE